VEGSPGTAGLDVLGFGDGADLDEDGGLVILKKLVIRFLSHSGILENEGKDNCLSKAR
jgi:hypothetical protein